MRWIIFILLLLVGCSSPQSKRSIASEPEVFGVVSLSNSNGRIYPSGTSKDGKLKYHVYLVLKDDYGQAVDCAPSEILLQSDRGQKLKYSYHRSSVGMYYLGLSHVPGKHSGEIEVRIGPALLTKLSLPQISTQLRSKIKLIKNSVYRATFHFQLLNEFEVPVNISEAPAIIIDDEFVLIEDVLKVNKNTWKFELVYPEDNQLIYISGGVKNLV